MIHRRTDQRGMALKVKEFASDGCDMLGRARILTNRLINNANAECFFFFAIHYMHAESVRSG